MTAHGQPSEASRQACQPVGGQTGDHECYGAVGPRPPEQGVESAPDERVHRQGVGQRLLGLGEDLAVQLRPRRIVRQNLALSYAAPAILVPGALLGVLNLPIAVAGRELSELFVILSGFRPARTGGTGS